MEFKVPQFLEIEDKIFGPFTFRQFVYLAGGAGMCYIIFKLLGFLFGIIPMLAIAGFALALAFYRPNSKPFINMVEAGFKYAVGDKLYIWKRHKSEISIVEQAKREQEIKRSEAQRGIRLGKSKLRDLAWSLDVLDLKKDNGS